MKYCSIVIVLLIFASCSSDKKNEKMHQATTSKPDYKLYTVKSGVVVDTVRLPARLAAYQEVSIYPKINGYVKDVMVDIGAKVKKSSILMMLEAPEMQQDVVQARERYAKASAGLAIDEEHYQRLMEASATEGAVSAWELSLAKNKVDADRAVCNGAKADWQMQETLLGYLHVTAPFEGVITERNVHPGVLVDAAAKDKPMLELKETDRLRLKVDIPESLSAGIHEKDTVCFYVSAMPGRRFTGTISRKSGSVNDVFRSERFEVDIDNREGRLAPGMYADVVIGTHGDIKALTVPRSAVVNSTERKYVLRYKDGKIRKVDVYSGAENLDKVQVYGDLHENDQVLMNANDEIEETQ